MKKLVFKKEEAQPLVEFLQGIALKNKVSRLRNKLIKRLMEIATETDEERIELCKEHAEKDESGEAIVEDDQYKVEDLEALNKEIQDLFQEEVAVEVGEYSSDFSPLFNYLDSEAFDMELSGVEANRYDRLLDIWETSQSSDADSQNEEEK